MTINKIRGYRNMLKMTQDDMAKEMGITKQAYYLKENGKREFKDAEKIKFKELLLPTFPNITLEDIFF
ncbi:helix-turn-helix domain-containing protein [Aerococcaceae bacterium zg-BR9]|uniref:helix-turn-helix transcriptional regulator n=1 Tax=Aerococcaceae bacterium zg-1292 TaxID=2774330 RepID=UPI00406337A0|nr:helix-turn-helix domain-containing protein [Aerococcaceae bacterium zg-BR9]MBF6978694.1 helix-turn-helix domain-containing protein [Aerococcaceae bacterium zg-BR22]